MLEFVTTLGKKLIDRGSLHFHGFEDLRNLRIINFLMLYSSAVSLFYTFFGIVLGYYEFSFLSLASSLLIISMYALNTFGRPYLNLILIICTAPWMLLCYTYNFGNVGIEYYLLSSTIVISFILGRNKKWLFYLLLYLMFMLLLDKIIEGSWAPQTPLKDSYGILLIRYLNILFCLIEVLLGIFLYYVELNSHIKIIDNQRLELEGKNSDIQQKNSELERHNKIRNKILSIIAHDFRGPLNTLKGTLPLLKRKELTELEKEKLINENQTRLESTSNLLEMLLSWAKSQYEGAGLKLENINISEVIESSINLYIPMATLKNITIENQTTPNIFFTIDKNMLSLIIRNLLANAIKFSYNNSIVTVSLKENIDEIVIQVIDSGTGMDPQDVERLFGKRHYTKFGTSGEAGSGLGLLLVKESIEANNGMFTVASELGKGSTFNVVFKKRSEA